MFSATLNVAMYRPAGGNVGHWALYLRIFYGNDIKHLIYQVNGEPKNFMRDVREGVEPDKSARYRKLVHVSDIDDKDTVNEVCKIISTQIVRNDVSTWSCQDFVLEALEKLDEECLLDEYQYSEAKEIMEEWLQLKEGVVVNCTC